MWKHMKVLIKYMWLKMFRITWPNTSSKLIPDLYKYSKILWFAFKKITQRRFHIFPGDAEQLHSLGDAVPRGDARVGRGRADDQPPSGRRGSGVTASGGRRPRAPRAPAPAASPPASRQMTDSFADRRPLLSRLPSTGRRLRRLVSSTSPPTFSNPMFYFV